MQLQNLSPRVEAHLETISHDGLEHFIFNDQNIRGIGLNATRLINQMMRNHKLPVLDTRALGFGYMGSLLISSSLKDSQRIKLTLQSEGLLKGFSVEVTNPGIVRGYLLEPLPSFEDLEIQRMNQVSLDQLIGEGTITVLRHGGQLRESMTSTVELKFKSISKDLSWYLVTSEQIPTAMALSMHFDNEGFVSGAGALMFQTLPGAEGDTIEALEKALDESAPIAQTLARGETLSNHVKSMLSHWTMEHLSSKPVDFFCGCSKERFQSYVRSLDLNELTAMVRDDEFPMMVHCHNCNTEYSFSKDEVEGFLQERLRED